MAEKFMSVEVAHATPEKQLILTATVPEGATVEQAIYASGILKHFPAIDLSQNKVGIFSSACALSRVLQESERVEIYRPLLHDPKETRKKRAAKEDGAET